MYSEAFVYRGVADSTVYKNETSQRLTGNYAQGFLFMADARRKVKDYEGALKHIHQGLEILPRSTDIYSFAAQVLGEMGRLDTMEAFIASAPESGRHGLYYNWGLAAKFAGRVEEAINILEMTMEMYPDYVEAFRSLVRIYYENKYYSRLRVLVEKWVSRHPEDTQSAELLRQIRMVDRSQDTLEGR
jgi:tetratricopeptide (TPR) repeat protein